MNWLRRLFCSHAYRLSDMSNDGRMREWTCDKCGKVKIHEDIEPPKRAWNGTGKFVQPAELTAECDCPGDEGSCAELPNCRFRAKA